MDIFPLSHLADLCALFQQTPCFQLDSANREHRWTGRREGSGVRLALLQLPPCILTPPSSREDGSSCQGGTSTRHAFSASRVWRLFMPRSSNAALLRGQRCFCVSLDLGRESSTLIKLWNLVSYCIAGDSLPSWPLGHCLLFPMLTHPLSLPLANPLLCTKESSSYVL